MRNRRTPPRPKQPDKCPKCGSGLVRGIVRFGHSADGWTCPMCGVNSEQGSYYDARTGRRVGL
jgi:ribosomal protein L37AE/L43A